MGTRLNVNSEAYQRALRGYRGAMGKRLHDKRTYPLADLEQAAELMNAKGEDGHGLLSYGKAIASGATAGIGDAMTIVGGLTKSDSLTRAGMVTSAFFDRHLGVDDPNVAHKVLNAVGFMGSLFIPGIGASKAGQAVGIGGKLMSKLGVGAKGAAIANKWTSAIIGGSVMSSAESFIEAGDQMERMIHEGKTRDQAYDIAKRGIMPNSIVGVATNLPYFSRLGRGMTAVAEAFLEGGQEMYQGTLDDWVMSGAKGGVPGLLGSVKRNWNDHWEEGGIGGFIGFTFGYIMGRKAKIKFKDKYDGKAQEKADKLKVDSDAEAQTAAEAAAETYDADSPMPAYRDKYAEMSDEDLHAAVSDLQAVIRNKESDDPAVLHEYTAAYEEAAYRGSAKLYGQRSSSELRDLGESILETPVDERTQDQALSLGYILTTLYERGEMTLGMVTEAAAEMGVPAQAVRALTRLDMPNIAPGQNPDVNFLPLPRENKPPANIYTPPNFFDAWEAGENAWVVSIPLESGSTATAAFRTNAQAKAFVYAVTEMGLDHNSAYDLATGRGPGANIAAIMKSATQVAADPGPVNLPVAEPRFVAVDEVVTEAADQAAKLPKPDTSQATAPAAKQIETTDPGDVIPLPKTDARDAVEDPRAPAAEPKTEKPGKTGSILEDPAIKEVAKQAEKTRSRKDRKANSAHTLTGAQSSALDEILLAEEPAADDADGQALAEAIRTKEILPQELDMMAGEVGYAVERAEEELESMISTSGQTRQDNAAINGQRSRIRSLKRLQRELERKSRMNWAPEPESKAEPVAARVHLTEKQASLLIQSLETAGEGSTAERRRLGEIVGAAAGGGEVSLTASELAELGKEIDNLKDIYEDQVLGEAPGAKQALAAVKKLADKVGVATGAREAEPKASGKQKPRQPIPFSEDTCVMDIKGVIREFGGGPRVEAFKFKEINPQTAPDTYDEFRTAQLLANKLGFDVVLYEVGPPTPFDLDGFFSPLTRRIYIQVDGRGNPVGTGGGGEVRSLVLHELIHAVARDSNGRMQFDLDEKVGPMRGGKPLAELREVYGKDRWGMLEEVAARSVEGGAITGKFWEDLAVELGGEKFKQVVRRLVSAFTDAYRAARSAIEAGTATAAGIGELKNIAMFQEAAFKTLAGRARALGVEAEVAELSAILADISATDMAEHHMKTPTAKQALAKNEAKRKLDRAIGAAEAAEKRGDTKRGHMRKGSVKAKELAKSIDPLFADEIESLAPKNWTELQATVRRLRLLSYLADGDPSPLGPANTIEEYLRKNGKTEAETKDAAKRKRAEAVRRAQDRIDDGLAVSKSDAKHYLRARSSLSGGALDVIVNHIPQAKDGQGRGLDPNVVAEVASGDKRNVTAFDENGETMGGFTFNELESGALEALAQRANKVIESEIRRVVKNTSRGGVSKFGQKVLDMDVAASPEAAIAMGCWDCAHSVHDSRVGEAAAEMRPDEGSDIPFRLTDGARTVISRALGNPTPVEPRVSAAKESDGPVMTAALDETAKARHEADVRRHEHESATALTGGTVVTKRLLDNLAGFREVLNRALDSVNLPNLDEIGLGRSPYNTMRTLVRSWTTVAESFMRRGVASLENGGVRFSERGLLEVLTDPLYAISENYEQFGEYLVAKRLVSVFQAKPGLFTSIAMRQRLTDAIALVRETEAAKPEWAQAASEFSDFGHGLIDFLAEVELLAADEAERIKAAYSFYAPLHMADNPLDAGHFEMAGKRKGMMTAKPVDRMASVLGAASFENPIESMMISTMNIVRAGMQNKAKIQTARLIESVAAQDPDVAKHLGEILDMGKFKRPIEKTREGWYKLAGVKRKQKAQIRERLKYWEVDPDIIAEVMEAFELTDSVANEQKKLWFSTMELKPGMVAYIENGKLKVMKVSEEIYDGIAQMNGREVAAILKMAGHLTRMLRSGAVLSPEFMARNPARDIINAAVVSAGAIKNPADVPRYINAFAKSIFEVVKQGPLYERWVMSGGAQADLVAMDRAQVSSRLKSEIETADTKSAIKHYAKPRNWLEAMRSMSGVMEETTRVAVFRTNLRANLDSGMPLREAELAAAMDSREASVDFARRGEWGPGFNSIIPFWNASIQGLDKLRRELFHPDKARASAAWIRAAALVTLPSMVMYAVNHDEEWYKALPRHEKNMYWHLKVGERVDASGKVYPVIARYPKPFELGLVFGSLFERIADYVGGEDPHALRSWAEQFVRTVQPFQVEQAVPPITAAVMAANNTDTWRQREIVKGSLQKLPARLQYSESTTSAARMIGSMFDVAPLKVDYYVRSAFGGLGRHGVDLVSAGVNLALPRFANTKTKPREILAGVDARAPILRAFFRTYAPGDYDRYTADFFDMLEKAERYSTELAWSTKGRIPIEEMGRDAQDNLHWVALYDGLNKMAKEVSNITAQIKAVEFNTTGTWTDEQRRARVQAFSRKRGELIRKTVEHMEEILADDELMERLRKQGESLARRR